MTDSPRARSSTSRNAFAITMLVVVVTGVLLIKSQSDKHDGQVTSAPKPLAEAGITPAAPGIVASTPSPDAVPTPMAESAHAEPVAPSMQSHNYALEEDGQYGYQPEISDEERTRGMVAKPLVMIRYRGEKNGTYVIERQGDTGEVLRMECTDLCKYVKLKLIVGGQTIKTETMPNTPGSLMHAVFEDAMDGQLKPYGKRGG